ncbi:DUF4856 domain-containing protein [Mariniflexile litorale]|uniref:DUF4856 domain-containing protein n=1 Tax=Mariniflexile litorale TaxID=3045158 RepID=A0AAU7EH83_9FLAO|nr:DUF4856 domain-containing protein [Mariniflexile sp. KMM 9835]MDQ8211698.1 DUF4856 domain-containing protein [Mariniflexile sp. KMM 9835]
MNKILSLVAVSAALLASCSKDDDNSKSIETPATYVFTRDNASTVDFNGQTTRIQMADAVVNALKDNTKTEVQLNAMFAHAQGENDFTEANLNASDKNVRSKVAASTDYYSANTTVSNAIKADFDGWIATQVSEVFPNWITVATAGNAGQLQQNGGGSIRYITGKGLELNQAFAKGLIGGLMMDQILNNYLSPAVLDAGSNIADNNNGVLEAGKSYTSMEHKWDEAYGYLYGSEANPAEPVLDADQFLSEYIERVGGDSDFSTLAEDVYNAFKLGRAAIVAKKYTIRDQQAEIIRENLSKIPAVRGVFYLQASKANLGIDNARAFHALSEAYGFIYSLQFTRKPNSTSPYVTKTEVDGYLAQLMAGNGFWDVTETTIDNISDAIAAKFGFTTAQAKDAN